MKNLVTLFTVCLLVTIFMGCSKGLSGTYKNEDSGQIVEFNNSTDFSIRHPDVTVATGTYEKKDGGYELRMDGGSAVTFAKKEGKSLRMADALYVKQNVNVLAILMYIYFGIAAILIIAAFVDLNEAFWLILMGILWPIVVIVLLILLICLFTVKDVKLFVDADPYADMEYPREE